MTTKSGSMKNNPWVKYYLPPLFFFGVIVMRSLIENQVLHMNAPRITYYTFWRDAVWYSSFMLGILILATLIIEKRVESLLWMMYGSIVMMIPIAVSYLSKEPIAIDFLYGSPKQIIIDIWTFFLSHSGNWLLSIEVILIFSGMFFIGVFLSGSVLRGLLLSLYVHVLGGFIATLWFRVDDDHNGFFFLRSNFDTHTAYAILFTYLAFSFAFILFWRSGMFKNGKKAWVYAVTGGVFVWGVFLAGISLTGVKKTLFDAVAISFFPSLLMFWGIAFWDKKNMASWVKICAVIMLIVHISVFLPLMLTLNSVLV